MARFRAGTASGSHLRGVVIVATLAALWATFLLPSGALEAWLPAFTGRFMAPAASSGRVVAVVFEADAQRPLPRERLAQAIERLHELDAAAIGVLAPLYRPGNPPALDALRSELDRLDGEPRKTAAAWLQRLDTDAQLAGALRRAGKVVLAVSPRDGSADVAGMKLPAQWLLPVASDHGDWRQRVWRVLRTVPQPAPVAVRLPLPRFLAGATPGLQGADPALRQVRLAWPVPGGLLPGLELALLQQVQADSEPVIVPGEGLRLAHPVLNAPDLMFYPRPGPLPPVYSLRQLMRDRNMARQLRGRAVLLGPADGMTEHSAQVLDRLVAGAGYAMPPWFYAAQRGLILLFGLYLLLLPWRWQVLRGPLLSSALGLLTLNAGVLALLLQSLWLPVVVPLLFLAGLQLLLMLVARYQAGQARIRQQVTEARVALGGHLQAQGQLELALEQYRPCLPAPAALEALYELGLECERRRQMQRARTVYELLRATAPAYRDVAERAARLATLAERFPGGGAGPGQTLVLDSPVVELPRLGRYRLEREIGRGAMGTVYLAEDPTIGRRVAIKTLPLEGEYEDEEQEQVAQRFLQEAEAAGRLDHPNIIAIHDAGREHDLAYLTMDYVEGESLEAWVDRRRLLPVWEVLDIGAQVAEALDYAHARQVVHRDIKPGNILYDRDSGTVKVTDFGVARMLDCRRTRTGAVLGTPSYMSPEQVAGARVDGQSDLFSLGVTLYQLLTGTLPFQGDSVAALMYRITNQKMPPLRKQRSGLPVCVGRLLGKALQKAPGKRFATGAEMAVALRKCRAQFRGGRRKTA